MSEWVRQWRDNPRLRVGVLLAAALVWLYALLSLADEVEAMNSERMRAAAELQRLTALERELHWNDYRADAVRTLADYRARSWREESEGRMQARLQDWLRSQLATVGLQPRELAATVLPVPGAEEDDPAGMLRLVRARASFDFDPAALHQTLATVRRELQWTWVSRLTVNNAGRRSVELEVEALFVLDARTSP